jgi:hypothetical protein
MHGLSWKDFASLGAAVALFFGAVSSALWA